MIKGHQSFSHKASGKLFLMLVLEKTILCNSNMGLEWVDSSGLSPKNGDYEYKFFDIGDCPLIQRVSASFPFGVCGNFFDYLIDVKICKNHTSDKFFSPEIEVLKQMKKHFSTAHEELPGQH